jgi:hypothetical protein
MCHHTWPLLFLLRQGLYVAQTGLKVTVFLPLPPECWTHYELFINNVAEHLILASSLYTFGEMSIQILCLYFNRLFIVSLLSCKFLLYLI